MIPEILAPASSQSLAAAVQGGADAVYLGAEGFNARARAHNFSNDTLRQAVQYCHVRGVRVYLAMNTLVRQGEMGDALALARYACDIGVDALILQDLGLARLLHKACPQMPLHASTQLSCHSPAGVRFLRDIGFCRVILSREMSLQEIAACCGLGCEIEVFVHGALCMSVSGQCYLSSVLGGRSGNRGACAQPCRLPFRAGKGTSPARDHYALSLRDNCLYPHIAALAAAGVASLKIEGRMKRPEYVAAAAAVYKAAAQGKQADEGLLQDLQAVFSRSGFTDGYLLGKRGGAMFGTRRHEDVTAADSGVLKRLAALYQKESPRVAVSMHLRVGVTAATLTVSDGAHTVTAATDAVQAAQRQPLTAAFAEKQLCKTGGTPFAATEITSDLHPAATLAASDLNALRRKALDALAQARAAVRPVPFDAPPLSQPPAAKATRPALVVRLATGEQLAAAAKHAQDADLWSVPLSLLDAVPCDMPFAVELPRGMFGTEDAVRAALQKARAKGARAALCGNIAAVRLCTETGLAPVAGFGLNVCNADAAALLCEQGVKAGVWSFEVPPAALPAAAAMPMGFFVYGRQPLMLTRNCPVSAAKGCGGCEGLSHLTDRTAAVFPVMCNGGCSEVLNAHTLYMADRLRALPAADFWYLHMTDEDADTCLATVRQYRSGGTGRGGITRGIFR